MSGQVGEVLILQILLAKFELLLLDAAAMSSLATYKS
jgi:hypothetical protein